MANIDAVIQNVNILTQDYCSRPSSSQAAVSAEESLSILNREAQNIEISGRLKPNSPHVEQFLHQTHELLSSPSTPVLMRSKLLLVLYNFAQHNVKIRRYLSGDLQIAGPVHFCLKTAVHNNLGPQNLIDVLRLLQVLTYEKNLALGDWTTELLNFLLSEIIKATDQEWLPYCVAILCNLVCRSKAVCSKIMKDHKAHSSLCKKLVEFLSNSSRTIVICSLTLVGYLHEQTRDIVFSPPHLSETFLCIFNIMKTGENIMTRHVAVDLCRRLIVSDSTNVKLSLSPTLANTAKDLPNYAFFDNCVRDLASHMVLLDPRTEESMKIYEFFIAICQLPELRTSICNAILLTKPTEKRLSTPVLGMLRTATLTFDDAIDPEVPILACELLTYVLKEAVDSSKPLQTFIPLDSLVDLIRFNVKTTIETKSEIVSYQCRRITCGLRLADAVSGDEEARKELLEAVTAQLCGHVNESQLLSNPVSLYLTKPPAQRASVELPEWSTYGITIPLELLKLLASLKDYNKAHKELYWRSIKDERLIPFLAYAISYGNTSVVYDALTLFTHCTQIQDYRIKLLSDLIASCGKTKASISSKDRKSSTENGNRRSNYMDTSSDFLKEFDGKGPSQSASQKDLDELLNKMKNNMDLRDVRFSHLVQVFENKIALLQEKERFLEQEVAELRRFNAMSRNRQDSNPLESAFQTVIKEMEQKVDEAETEKAALQSEKEVLAGELAKIKLNQENMQLLLESTRERAEKLQQDKALLMEENKKERDVHLELREKFNEMVKNFDKATQTALEKQQEVLELNKELTNSKAQIAQLQDQLRQEKIANEKLKKEKAEMAGLKQNLLKMLNQ